MMCSSQLYLAFAACVLFLSLSCEDASSPVAEAKDGVEISPNEWLSITQLCSSPRSDPDDEWSELRFEWKGRKVNWRGPEIPITLREFEGGLYMIGLNRTSLSTPRFQYFQLKAAAKKFKRISYKEFPPSIATQNLWLRPSDRHAKIYVKAEDRNYLVDTWEMLRKLDVESPAFSLSYTAAIWYQIETGVEYSKQPYVTIEFRKDYVRKHKPLALPTIVRDEKRPSNTHQPNKSREDKRPGG